MANQFNFQSAGVSARVINLTGPTAIQPVGIPAGVIATAQKGPAFVPVTVPSINDFVVVFGSATDYVKNGVLAASEWLSAQQALTFVRPLGAGDASARLTSGNNKGKVNSAGFVVGDQQPQAVLSGGLGTNLNANAGGPLGRTYFLGAYMSQSVGSTVFTDAGLLAVNPIVRGVIMAASGVILTLSTSNTASAQPGATVPAAYNSTLQGALTGNLNLSGSKQEFVMLLNGHKGQTALYPNIVTASFDINASNYFGTIFNKDASKLEDAGYVLYSFFDIHPAQAVPSGSTVIVASSGASVGGAGFEKIAFLLTGSQTRNSGSSVAPNFENFEDRYRTSSTPWFVSQKFGGSPANLFKIHSLDDGEYPVGKYKVSIENVLPSNNDSSKYGTFDLIVRDFNDNDNNRVILEQWRKLSLNPSDQNFIARVIGDYRTFFNFEAVEGSQKLVTEGEFENRSKYIRVQLSEQLQADEVDATALPMGFRGPQHLMTSGSAPMPAFTDAGALQMVNPFNKLVQLPVPFRQNLKKGVTPNVTTDRTLYWGVQFEYVISTSESNSTTVPNKSMASFGKYYPNFQTEWANVAVRDNSGTPDTAANGIVDADRFAFNMFSLENIRVKYLTTTGLADTGNLDQWTYVRNGSIATDTTNLFKPLAVSDLVDPTVRGVAKFTVYLEGGFDGVRIFDTDSRYMTNKAVVEEMTSTTRGFSSGPTVRSYIKAIDIMKDVNEVDIQLLAIPGIRQRFITDTAVRATESDRFDAMFIMDIEERDTVGNLITSDAQNASVRYTTTDFRGRGLNSSFAAAYFPDAIIKNPFTRNTTRVPPSVAVLGAIANNDAVAYPWNAPAGYARARLTSTQNLALSLSRTNMDDLYSVNINPLVSFPGEGPVVWGQKTTQSSQSALDRISVRRLLIAIRRQIKKVGNRILFEQNKETTLERFAQLVNPILKLVQDTGGLEAYKVEINTSTTTQLDIENKTIRGKIFVVPTRTLEFLSLDFVINNAGVSI